MYPRFLSLTLSFSYVISELLVIYNTLNLSTHKADLEGIAMNTNQSLLGQLLMHAHKVFDIMSMLAVHPDETTFGYLACRYAPKGLENKIIELQDLEFRFSFTTKSMFICDGWLAAIQLVNNLIKDGEMYFVVIKDTLSY